MSTLGNSLAPMSAADFPRMLCVILYLISDVKSIKITLFLHYFLLIFIPESETDSFFLIKAAALTILIIRVTIVYAGSHSSVYMKELPHK